MKSFGHSELKTVWEAKQEEVKEVKPQVAQVEKEQDQEVRL